ncbi:MAG: Plasmid replication initiation protein [Bacteroidota bacterium]|jgi:plasmid replication initiation protein
MREITIAQDNRLTTARYELSLIEKRVFYYIIKEVRNRHINGTVQRDLFDDMNLKINVSDLTKEVNARENNAETKKALKSLRKRSFEWDNGLDEGDESYEWFEVGFINYSEIKKGIAEIQVSKKLMPFLVELSGQFTPYSLNVAMSLKSKWSQRMYELCQKWHGTDGFRISVADLRKSFVLEEKYNRYALLNERVLQVANRELKALYDIGQCDVYFEFSEERNGRSVEMLRFKLFRKNSMNVKTTHDMLLELIPVFASLFNTLKMPKNDTYINKVILQLQKYPNLIEPLNTRIKEILSNGVKEDTQRYVRFVLNEDILSYSEKPIETKKVAKNEEKEPNDIMAEILGLANGKKM